MEGGGFDAVWARIVAAQGERFHQKTGRPFTYVVHDSAVLPDTTNRQIPRSHFEQASRRRPLDGPGRLQDLQGPSYLYAILTDPRVGALRGRGPAEPAPIAAPAPPRAPSFDPSVVDAAELPLGRAVDPAVLAGRGFLPLDLHLEALADVGGAPGTNWTTVGDVPSAPGLYAFTLERSDEQVVHVVYVGMTEHLLMVTNGMLPGGQARGGQRYGRPRHAGATRQRVNRMITRAVSEGWLPRHWVKPYPAGDGATLRARLRDDEAALILRWNLTEDGWNRI